jgi:hypothetical protein
MHNDNEVIKRLRLAELIAPVYAANPKVAAIIAAGSVGRGTADAHSDIEVDIFWREMPTIEERMAPIAAAGWELLYSEADANEWAEGFFIEGIKVDTSQFLVETIERWLADVVERADTEAEKQMIIAAIQDGRTLYGAELIDRWRERAAAYPDALARAMVAEHLAFRPRALLEMFAARDDLLILHRGLVEIEQRILDVLLGLNRMYMAHPYHKWLDWEVARMRVAPPNLGRRLRAILRAEPRAAAAEIHLLIEETFALVERHLPDFDTRPARAEFEQRRVNEAAPQPAEA